MYVTNYVCFKAQMVVLRYLIDEAGINPRDRDEKGRTAKEVCTRDAKGRRVVEYLTKKWAEQDAATQARNAAADAH